MTENREILIGVTGGVAAYKAADLVSKLAQAGAAVSVVMTQSAQAFVGTATFAALSGRPVHTDLFDRAFPLGAHIELARRAELLCIAPASADYIAKAANGIADDLLSTLYLCFQGPVLIAPAMNHEMWSKSSVQRNVSRLQDDGVLLVGPDDGWLSCRERGIGRMADPQQIVAACTEALRSS